MIRPIRYVAILVGVILRNSASVHSGTPAQRILIVPPGATSRERMGPGKRVHVLTEVLVAVAISLATRICLIRIWTNRRKISRSLKRNTSARRSTVREEEATTLPVVAPHHPQMVNRTMGIAIPFVVICVKPN